MQHVTYYVDGEVLTPRYVDGTVLTLPDGDGAGLKWPDGTNCMQEMGWASGLVGWVGGWRSGCGGI